MKQPKELTAWDFKDTLQIPNGYDLTSIPDITRDNFQTLIDEHNNLVEIVQSLMANAGIELEE